MFKPVLFSLAVAATSFASTASADNLNILFVDGGFFPEITYLQPGDTATFINETETSITAEASDQSWTTGLLAQNASYILSVTSTSVLTFNVAGDPTKAGSLSFDLAPLVDNDESDDAGIEEVDVSSD
ncbi:MAG: hypothetical protein WBC85_08015 [Planktotalea sp.]|uniref:hypothetical protein n=1 Tax=Planktotalea sp. TaxID=2029877 RepID=UPI003C77AE75